MNQELIKTIFESMVHLLLWSTTLVFLAHCGVRLLPSFRYWSTMWKTTLLLCFLPLIPWSYFELTYVSQVLLDLPQEWFGEFTDIGSAEETHASNAESAPVNSLAFAIAVLMISTISLLKILRYYFRLRNFKRELNSYESVSSASKALRFLTESQRIFIEKRRIEILTASAKTSPYVTGVFKPKLVLPLNFYSLPEAQQILLFEHELTHIRRKDVNWLNVSQILKRVLWFIPAIHFIHVQLEFSIEIECDAKVLETYPKMKKEYGNALLNIIKLTHQKVQPQAAFFINQQFEALKNRIILTQQKNKSQGVNTMNKITLGLSALLISSTSWALNAHVEKLMNVEEFLAIHKQATRYINETSPTIIPSGTWVNPLKAYRVSSKYKSKRKINGSKAHLGIDLAANKGEPIIAASKGIVVIADDSTLHENYGKIVVIDHGEGTLSMYLHMDSIGVEKGDTIKLGQALGKVGSTGQSTGPHLHFEIIVAGRHIDPASVIKF